jgi:hypothetical protein
LTALSPQDLAALRRAVEALEYPGLAARLTNLVGTPIELVGRALPAFASQAIARATSKGLEVALSVALRTMKRTPQAASHFLHKALATASGAAGGAFGLASLTIELPVSTIRGPSRILPEARGRIFPIRKRHSPASKSLPWADGLALPMLRKADISRCGACLRRV